MEIPFSPQNPGNLTPVILDINQPAYWLFEELRKANCSVKKNQIEAFDSIVFKKSHLKAILAQEDCAFLAFSHIVAMEKNGSNFTPVSTLLAVGENIFGDKIINKGDKLYIGTKAVVDFQKYIISQYNIIGTKVVQGYDWQFKAPVNTEVKEWLKMIRQWKLMPDKIDFFVRARIQKGLDDLLGDTGVDNFIAFFPGVFTCKIAPGQHDKTGDFCTLIACELDDKGSPLNGPNAKFFICSDAWRPNWPIGTPPAVKC